MSRYDPPLRDMQFVLHELLELTEVLGQAGYSELDIDIVNQVLDAAGEFASEVIAPLNGVGDAMGCGIPQPGVVTTPPGFKEAYHQFITAGWTGLACDPQFGGQGFPDTVNNAIYEMFCGANMGWSAYPGMSHAAYTCLAANGSSEQKELYLPQIASGVWAGTMCLTEPHAGTDLGLLRTKAVPEADGTYRITGTKIFISGGEQDLTDNIVHLVLARMPDSPPGVKGISLFIVPKFLPSSSGAIGARNGVSCGSIEEKMGIHGNATCTMNFESAQGWLLGEPNKGLAGMFVMMNHARIVVGVNAIGLAEAGYQKSLAYAKDRLQGRTASSSQAGNHADPIIGHADVRRMLWTQKAYVEGLRALSLWVTQLMDLEHRSLDNDTRAPVVALVALMTPIVKAFSSDLAVECTSTAMQVYGGHGYIRDNGVEQHLRDARIIPLYEGANGVQAMDLLARKVLSDNGARFSVFVGTVQSLIVEHDSNPALAEFIEPLSDVLALAQAATKDLLERCQQNPDEIGSAAVAYLRLTGHLALAWMWTRMAAIALANIHSGDPHYVGKLATARFYFKRLLPEVHSRYAEIQAGSAPVMDPALDLV